MPTWSLGNSVSQVSVSNAAATWIMSVWCCIFSISAIAIRKSSSVLESWRLKSEFAELEDFLNVTYLRTRFENKLIMCRGESHSSCPNIFPHSNFFLFQIPRQWHHNQAASSWFAYLCKSFTFSENRLLVCTGFRAHPSLHIQSSPQSVLLLDVINFLCYLSTATIFSSQTFFIIMSYLFSVSLYLWFRKPMWASKWRILIGHEKAGRLSPWDLLQW